MFFIQIDQDNITSDIQIQQILEKSSKDTGVAAFIKYHFELLEIIRQRLDFSVNYRNARGWAGRIGNSTYRVGYIGIMQRNEADIGTSGVLNRINRFAEFDTIHQSWKLETAFLYRFTPNLNTHNKRGNFLAPFEVNVWLLTLGTIIALNIIWFCTEYGKVFLRQIPIFDGTYNRYVYSIPLNIIGAISQQGLDPMPRGFSVRIITISTFTFSLVMYNYYTSSLVGGLLSNTAQGPTSVEEITASDLRVSFEDIGYYKVLFRVSKQYILQCI